MFQKQSHNLPRVAEASHARESLPTTPLTITYIGFVTGEGGDAMQMLELAAGMQAQGHSVRLLVPDLPATRLFVLRCQSKGLSAECVPQISSQASLLDLIRLFARFRDQLLHLHTGDLMLPANVTLALLLLRLPHVFVTVHHSGNYLDFRSFRARLWKMGVRGAIQRVVCPSDYSLGTQRRYGLPPERLIRIRNGVDTHVYGSGDSRAVWQNALSTLPADAQILLFTARMEASKRPADVLNAFMLIASYFPRVHLVFAGWGPEEETLRASVGAALAGRVHFVGFQTNLPDWLAAATVWVHASTMENCSLALLEALAAGCAIVATHCAGNNEVLYHGGNALTVEPRDVAGFARALGRLLSDPALREHLSQGARQSARAFSQQRMVREYLRLYLPAMGDIPSSDRSRSQPETTRKAA